MHNIDKNSLTLKTKIGNLKVILKFAVQIKTGGIHLRNHQTNFSLNINKGKQKKKNNQNYYSNSNFSSNKKFQFGSTATEAVRNQVFELNLKMVTSNIIF